MVTDVRHICKFIEKENLNLLSDADNAVAVSVIYCEQSCTQLLSKGILYKTYTE